MLAEGIQGRGAPSAAKRYSNVTFIWSHGGGTAPYITSRLGAAVGPDGKPNANLAALQKFYYDTAQAFNPYTLATFTRVVPNAHILFGTDYPFAQASTVAKGLADYSFTPAQLRAIERDNALALFPADAGLHRWSPASAGSDR